MEVQGFYSCFLLVILGLFDRTLIYEKSKRSRDKSKDLL